MRGMALAARILLSCAENLVLCRHDVIKRIGISEIGMP